MRRRVTPQARRIHLFGSRLGGAEDFGQIAARLHMGAARAVTALAGRPGFAVLLGKQAVRIGCEVLRLIHMAGRANLSPDKIRRIRHLAGRVCNGMQLRNALPGRQDAQAHQRSNRKRHEPASHLGPQSEPEKLPIVHTWSGRGEGLASIMDQSAENNL